MKSLPLLLCLSPLAWGQFYNISTIAGSGRLQFTGGGPAINARLVEPRGLAVDSTGNVYVSDWYYHQVFQISATGAITVYAGTGQPGFSGDGRPATTAALNNPTGLAVDAARNLYISDFANSRVRKVSPEGTISTFAGNGRAGAAGDGGSAASATVGGPWGLALDATGNLFVSQPNNNVIRMVGLTGSITTIAGTGAGGYSGDGGMATAAMLLAPEGLTVDKSGNVYVADNQNSRVRKITPQGMITTFAGNGRNAFAGDGMQATAASLFFPTDVVLDSAGNVYIADAITARIRAVNAAGVISTFAGGGGSLQDGNATQASLGGLNALAIDSQGNIFASLLSLHLVRRVTPQQIITTIAGVLPTLGAGDNTAATSTVLFDPLGVAVDSAGTVYVTDLSDNRIRKISTTGIITTVSGNGLLGNTGDGGPASAAQIGTPRGLSLDPNGNLYVTSGLGAIVRRIAANGTIATVAGNNSPGFSGDGGKATSAQLLAPYGVAGDAAGNIYIADSFNPHPARGHRWNDQHHRRHGSSGLWRG